MEQWGPEGGLNELDRGNQERYDSDSFKEKMTHVRKGFMYHNSKFWDKALLLLDAC